jgi:hypothetical protein
MVATTASSGWDMLQAGGTDCHDTHGGEVGKGGWEEAVVAGVCEDCCQHVPLVAFQS